MNIGEIRRDTKFWQRLLKNEGFYVGYIDGLRGVLQERAEELWATNEYTWKNTYGTFDKRTEENLATLVPSAQKVARQFMSLATKKAEELGIVVKVIDGTRSYAEQDKLYNKKPRVTKAKGGYSWHNFGMAFDIGLFTKDGEYLGNSKHYATLGKLVQEVPNLEWGGSWKIFVDEPHYQLKKYKTIAEARKTFNNMR